MRGFPLVLSHFGFILGGKVLKVVYSRTVKTPDLSRLILLVLHLSAP